MPLYTSTTDTLNGYWRCRSGIQQSYYNNNGDWETRPTEISAVKPVNFQQNKCIEWEFDDFNFRNDLAEIKAEQYSLSTDRVYEFERRQGSQRKG